MQIGEYYFDVENNAYGALKAYNKAVASTDRKNPYRLSALARCAAIYEAKKDYARAYTAYRDIAQNSKDGELAAAAAGRAQQLQPRATKKR